MLGQSSKPVNAVQEMHVLSLIRKVPNRNKFVLGSCKVQRNVGSVLNALWLMFFLVRYVYASAREDSAECVIANGNG